MSVPSCISAGSAGSASDTAAQVFVPDFWDPAALPAAPDPDQVKSLRFVTETDDPPFSFTLADGTLAGFDVDLARALCETLKASCTIQARPFATIVPTIETGGADAAIASLAITDKALGEVDFTAPYYKTPARFAARRVASGEAPVFPDAGSLAGRRVAVVRGTAHEAYLRSFFPEAELRAVDDAGAAWALLKDGSVDLVFGDGIGFARWLESAEAAGCCILVGGPYTESRFFGRGAGIAVRRNNGALRAALDYALAKLAAEGRYGDLFLKYFPVDPY